MKRLMLCLHKCTKSPGDKHWKYRRGCLPSPGTNDANKHLIQSFHTMSKNNSRTECMAWYLLSDFMKLFLLRTVVSSIILVSHFYRERHWKLRHLNSVALFQNLLSCLRRLHFNLRHHKYVPSAKAGGRQCDYSL